MNENFSPFSVRYVTPYKLNLRGLCKDHGVESYYLSYITVHGLGTEGWFCRCGKKIKMEEQPKDV